MDTLVYLAIALVSLIAYLYRKQYSYWKVRGVPQCEPQFPYGNFKDVGKTRHIVEPFNEAYNKFKGKTPFVGVYMMLSPTAVVTDLNLAKNIFIKDFHNFTDRGRFANPRDDPLSAHLFNVDGVKWKNLRQKLTPAFAFGKTKCMFPTVLKVATELIDTLEDFVQSNHHLETRDILRRYTTDVIGTCAFGIECNSLKDPNTEFRVMSHKGVFTKNHGPVVDHFMIFFPRIATFFRMRRTASDVHDFFMNLIKDTVDYRQKNDVYRNDFINILMEMKNNKDGEGLQSLTIEEIAAQSYLFFIAGFETSSTTMSFCLYELALNQGIQDRLRQDIVQSLDKHDNKFTYESVKDMKYLKMVIYETLRMYPILPFLPRIALNDYRVEGSKFIIEKGTRVIVPIMAIQHDPEIYPNPEVFDPDRFSGDEMAKRHPMAWLPFGDGPRNCIGLQFGKMQVSIGLAMMLKNFRFSVCSETEVPLTFGNVNILLYHKNGMVLKVEKV